MRIRCLLPSSPSLLKGETILLYECEELICRSSMNMVAVLACVIIDLLSTQLPYKMDFSTSFHGYGIGNRIQAAKVRLPNFCNKVLHHNSFSDSLNVY